jgi:hypothetical protein
VIFKTSLNAAVKKLLLQYHTGTTFMPLYYTTLIYKVVKDNPAVNTLSGYRILTNSLPSFSGAALWAPSDFLCAKESHLEAFDRFDATAEWCLFAGDPGVTTETSDAHLDPMFCCNEKN